MSLPAVRQALETALNGMSPSLPTAWQNVAFTPTPGVAYQRAYLLAAEPDNIEIGPGYTERGFLQIDLCYPLGNGPASAEARAELIRTTFRRGASFTASGTTVNIERTPEIAPAQVEDDAFVVRVRVRFYAHAIGG